MDRASQKKLVKNISIKMNNLLLGRYLPKYLTQEKKVNRPNKVPVPIDLTVRFFCTCLKDIVIPGLK
jgi:hypothetical protein